MKEIKKVDLKSLDIQGEQKEKLKQLFPEVFNEDKIDFEKLKLVLGEDIDIGRERYGMNWPGKAQAIKVAQLPSIATLKPDEKASVDFDTTQNIFIEGDNLEVLKLLQKSYFGKIKMIYIDPPYNTGKEFIYPDKYEEGLQTYLQYTGQIGEDGKKFSTNVETDGRYHSKWMNMMWSRLFLARNLLTEDGVVFISIDDHEVDNLKKICNEIFGEENFVACVPRTTSFQRSGQEQFMNVSHDYVLIYIKYKQGNDFKNVSERSNNKIVKFDKNGAYIEGDTKAILAATSQGYSKGGDYDFEYNGKTYSPVNNKGIRNRWLWTKERMQAAADLGILVETENSLRMQLYLDKKFEEGTNKLVDKSEKLRFHTADFMKEKFDNPRGTFLLKKLFNNPKAIELIEYLVNMSSDKNDIILDFFAGSGTTAHAVMDLNAEDGGSRKFIMVQLPEKTPEDSEAYKAGYKDITEIGEERIRRAGKKIIEYNKDKEGFDIKKFDKGFKVFKLDKSNFATWDGSKEGDIQKKLELNVDNINSKSKEEDVLYEILVKAGFELTTKIDEVKINNKKVYSILDGQLLICLDKKLDKNFVKGLSEKKPKQFICLNSSFENDADLTNTAKILENNQIEFRVV